MHLVCEECGAESATGKGWRAYITESEFAPAEVGVYCPEDA